MALFPLARPAWSQQFARDPLGLVTTFAVPVALTALVLFDNNPSRLPAILALGWTLVGLLPPAVRGRTSDPGLNLRWHAQPFGAADRWTGAIATHVPVAVGFALLITCLAYVGKAPAGFHSPWLFLIAALAGKVAAIWGVALGALSFRAWHRAGLLGFGLALTGWALLPGAPPQALLGIPAGQSIMAMKALPGGLNAMVVPLLELVLSGLVGVVVGVVAYGRR